MYFTMNIQKSPCYISKYTAKTIINALRKAGFNKIINNLIKAIILNIKQALLITKHTSSLDYKLKVSKLTSMNIYYTYKLSKDLS